ncbi:putative Nucleoporin complex subunit 54 [Trypanosoma vivax]|uniref:Putative nucleoporin (NUP54/57) n=1 Tax=Trypanosoma vivax (strain Y486) TaxID=1055687 RepID=G0TZN7_TRYVY|nr:putative nucleoporin (NUP54/57) [Trypanosoma vivax]KAH8617636.1 putative Nucleoporin complex subunit 54 [Trypanosoma vivax]CCC50065.1 putative nucleoporin (NUP54/57) [Trypanosoma vivax Y486]
MFGTTFGGVDKGTGSFGIGATATANTNGIGVGIGATTSTNTVARGSVPGNVYQQDVGVHSALGRYLLELDNAYNALHPNCRFRAFLYNMCTPGQSTMAVERERLIAAAAGGGCKEEDLLRAQERNPDPFRMYPTQIHFMQELKIRAEKQQEMMASMSKHADALVKKTERFRELDEANAAKYCELLQGQAMLQRRWYSLLLHVETLRRLGTPLEEESRITNITSLLKAQLAAPGMYKAALAELQPFLDGEAASVASVVRSRSSGEAAGDSAKATVAENSSALLKGRVDPLLLKNWVRYAERIQQGVEGLYELLEQDTADMRAIRRRVSSA